MQKYYNQSEEWAQFFLKANPIGHDVIKLDYQSDTVYIYEYPLFGKFKFWYIPRLQVKSLDLPTKEFFDKLRSKAKENNIIHISMDFDTRLLDKEFVPDKDTKDLGVNLTKSFKKLQYLSTPLLDTSDLNGEVDENPQAFFANNEKNFFSKVNKTCRNLTRRALEKDWKCEEHKDESEFDQFWNIWEDTSKRQGFNLHPKSYIKSLLEFDFAKLFVLKDAQDAIQGGWVLVNINDSVINLYGANSNKSLESGGQYFFHVNGLQYIRELQRNGKTVNSYDLCGNDDAGYGNFKKSYKPEIVNFVGSYDMVTNSLIYNFYKILVQFKNLIKGLKLGV
jgi:lipid II:glycine glycyltransferase (peptidoglycan interpeptide bridge formation enzyme)